MGLREARKRIESLEREVQSSPTPVNMVALVERYMAAAEKDRALEWARRAIGRFPDSEKCLAAYQNVQRMRLERDIVELNQAIRRIPNKTSYEQLASLYFQELGDKNKGYELALEGLSRFQDSDGLHLLCGQVRMDRFHKDWLANDFTEAVRHFEHAAEINSGNFKANLLLGRLYAETGAYDRSKPCLEAAVKAGGGDPELEKLVNLVSLRSGSTGDLDKTLMDIEQERKLSAEGQEVLQIFEPHPRGGTTLEISPSRIETFLASYASMSGYRASAVITKEGYVVAAHTTGQFEKEKFAQLLQAVVRCCEDGARRMDIGSFVNSEIESSLGRISLAEWKNLVIGILADGQAKKYDLDGAIEKFISFTSVA